MWLTAAADATAVFLTVSVALVCPQAGSQMTMVCSTRAGSAGGRPRSGLSSPRDVRPSSVQDVLESDNQHAQGSCGEGLNGQIQTVNPSQMCRVGRSPGQHRHCEPERQPGRSTDP
jgi:hypothetical protein